MNEQVKVWVRAGITINVSAEDAEKIIKDGDQKVLYAALEDHTKWAFDGETYMPEICVREVAEELGIELEEYGDIDF